MCVLGVANLRHAWSCSAGTSYDAGLRHHTHDLDLESAQEVNVALDVPGLASSRSCILHPMVSTELDPL